MAHTANHCVLCCRESGDTPSHAQAQKHACMHSARKTRTCLTQPSSSPNHTIDYAFLSSVCLCLVSTPAPTLTCAYHHNPLACSTVLPLGSPQLYSSPRHPHPRGVWRHRRGPVHDATAPCCIPPLAAGPAALFHLLLEPSRSEDCLLPSACVGPLRPPLCFYGFSLWTLAFRQGVAARALIRGGASGDGLVGLCHRLTF